MVLGRGKTEAATSEAEDNTELLARQELCRLTRQLRLMENDKRAYLEESNAAIKHQKNLIDTLNRQSALVEQELEVFRTKHNEERDSESFQKVSKLVADFKSMDEEYRRQNEVMHEVSQKLSLTNHRIKELKIQVEAEEHEELTIEQLEHKIFIAKRKLETVTAQFDAVVADNAQSRRVIDETLQDNVVIARKSIQLEEDVTKRKAEIDELVDEATSAYDQREEAVAKANALLERNAKERKQYTLEMSELSRVIRHEEKLLGFMNTKNKERLFLETDDERISRLEQAKEQVLDQALESYRDNFEKLLTPLSPTIPDLIEEYEELYNNNIRKFAYINELNTEIERLQGELFNLRAHIKRCSLETVERNQTKNKIILARQELLENLEKEYEAVQTQLSESRGSIQEIVEAISNLFRLTDYNGTVSVLELLGNQQDISYQNSLLYMNILEDRIGEIFSYRSDKRGLESGPGTPAQTRPRSARPPSKAGSEISVSIRPRIVVSDRNSETWPNSDEEFCYQLVETEENPLGYTAMRDKISVASGSPTPSSISDDEDSISSNILIINNEPIAQA